MTTKTAFALFILGLILTAFGVGGIEHSISDGELLSSMFVSIVGLLIMYAGTVAMRVSDYYDPRG